MAAPAGGSRWAKDSGASNERRDGSHMLPDAWGKDPIGDKSDTDLRAKLLADGE
jgi:hypothetical protein